LGDEVGQFDTPDLLDILRSNVRGPREMPIRVVLAANPSEYLQLAEAERQANARDDISLEARADSWVQFIQPGWEPAEIHFDRRNAAPADDEDEEF
jgi:hypothetical protein